MAQAVFAEGGINKVRRLAHYAETEAEVRTNLTNEFTLRATDNLETRMIISDFIAAWSDARKQAAREAEIRADKRVSDIK